MDDSGIPQRASQRPHHYHQMCAQGSLGQGILCVDDEGKRFGQGFSLSQRSMQNHSKHLLRSFSSCGLSLTWKYLQPVSFKVLLVRTFGLHCPVLFQSLYLLTNYYWSFELVQRLWSQSFNLGHCFIFSWDWLYLQDYHDYSVMRALCKLLTSVFPRYIPVTCLLSSNRSWNQQTRKRQVEHTPLPCKTHMHTPTSACSDCKEIG